jgi:hypothetical protein
MIYVFATHEINYFFVFQNFINLAAINLMMSALDVRNCYAFTRQSDVNMFPLCL